MKSIKELEEEKKKLQEENEINERRKKLESEVFQLKHGKKLKLLKGVGNMLVPKKLPKPIELKCKGCGRKVKTDMINWSTQPCKECGNYFKVA